jgi:ubiquinone/menaquinone biosynthesis C-methylase UbiE
MTVTPSPSAIAEKRAFYGQAAVAADYDRQRYGGASGAWVSQRELAIVVRHLPVAGVVGDIACGSGRMSAALRDTGRQVLSFDQSGPMLRVAHEHFGGAWVQADAFTLPVATGALDAIVAARLLFHFAGVLPLLEEFRRVTRQGGTLVCDTYNWTPRALLPVGRHAWGSRVYTLPASAFRQAAQSAGWTVRAEERCFLFSPYLYRRLPMPLVRRLAKLERVAPQTALCRTFWELG